jgi:hypothetical protein
VQVILGAVNGLQSFATRVPLEAIGNLAERRGLSLLAKTARAEIRG